MLLPLLRLAWWWIINLTVQHSPDRVASDIVIMRWCYWLTEGADVAAHFQPIKIFIEAAYAINDTLRIVLTVVRTYPLTEDTNMKAEIRVD
jgi:hypothetical protein